MDIDDVLKIDPSEREAKMKVRVTQHRVAPEWLVETMGKGFHLI